MYIKIISTRIRSRLYSRIKNMSFFGGKSNGNFTAHELADPVKFEIHVSRICGTDLNDIEDGLLLVFTRAGLSVIDELFGWCNVGKFLVCTCVNELTRIAICEVIKFLQNNYM